MNDKDNYRIFIWVDNSIVKMVSTVYNGDEDDHIEQLSKKPCSNKVKKKCVKEYWEEDHTKTIAIPQIIDNYNHWMIGTDVADQFIAYY